MFIHFNQVLWIASLKSLKNEKPEKRIMSEQNYSDMMKKSANNSDVTHFSGKLLRPVEQIRLHGVANVVITDVS